MFLHGTGLNCIQPPCHTHDRVQISDGKMDHKLYGPPHTFWSASFNTAMCLFLACLDSFATFVRGLIERGGKPPLQVWNTIDAEKGNIGQPQGRTYTIRFNGVTGGTEEWNKALKLMLVNLKALLAWVAQDRGIVGADSMAVSPQIAAGASDGAARAPTGLQALRKSMMW